MTNKEDLKRLTDEFEKALPCRKNGDRRISNPDDRKLVELLRKIVDALPD